MDGWAKERIFGRFVVICGFGSRVELMVSGEALEARDVGDWS